MKFVFFDTDDALSGYVTFELPQGYSIYRSAEEAKKIEDILLEFPKEEIAGFVTIVGQDKSRGMSFGEGIINKSYVGNIAIHFADEKILARGASEIMNDIREKLNTLEGFTSIESDIYAQSPPVGRPVTVTFVSNNDELRTEYKDKLLVFLKQREGLINIEDNQDTGKKQITIQFDYDLLARNGISPSEVAATVRSAFAGTVVTSVDWDGDEVDFRVMLNEKSRSSMETLTSLTVQDVKSLTIQNRYGNLLPIGQFVKLEEKSDLLKINHENGDRAVTVYADLDQVNFPDVTSSDINHLIQDKFQDEIDSNPEIRMDFGGEEKEVQEAMVNFVIAAFIVMIAIYFILVILFDSFIQPILVMLAIPFSFAGVIVAFKIHLMPLSIPAIIGLLGLMGVVVNDSLVMISFLNKRVKEHGFSIKTVREAAKKRLRPIFITTVTTAAGLFPLAYGFGGKDSFASPMVLTIAWGLIFATFVTLLLLPVLYMLLTRFTKLNNSQN
jgi:multidrug efflux pump subunit AcrB